MVGFAGQGDQGVALRLILDAVELQQIGDVAVLESNPPQLQAANLGLGRADAVPRSLPGQIPRLPETS